MESRRRRSRSQLLKWGCYVLALFVCAALQTTPGLFQLGSRAKSTIVLPILVARKRLPPEKSTHSADKSTVVRFLGVRGNTSVLAPI